MLCSIHFWSTVSDPICVGNHVYTHHPDPKVEMIPAQRYVSEEGQVFQNIQKAVAAHSTDQVLVE